MHCAWCRCSFASGLAHFEFPFLVRKFNHSHMANGASVHKQEKPFKIVSREIANPTQQQKIRATNGKMNSRKQQTFYLLLLRGAHKCGKVETLPILSVQH